MKNLKLKQMFISEVAPLLNRRRGWGMRLIFGLLCTGLTQFSYSQFIVTDPIHTGVTSLIKLITDPSFKTMVKQIENLKKVSGAVRQFHRGTQIISEVTECTQKLSKYSAAISKDGHISAAEYALIAEDVVMIVKEGKNILKDMKSVVTAGSSILKMDDAQRAKWLDDTYRRVNKFSNGIDNYFSFVRTRSSRRSANGLDLFNTVKLYDTAALASNSSNALGDFSDDISGSTYDGNYDDSGKSVLDTFTTSQEAKILKKQQEDCERAINNFNNEVAVVEKRMDIAATSQLISEGWRFVPKLKKRGLFQQASISIGGNLTQATDPATGQITGTMGLGGWSNGTITEEIEEDVEGWFDPTGKKISNDLFLVEMQARSAELMVAKKEDLRLKWGLDKCRNFGG
ncbi:MAG: hypothetical protein V4683_15505 [Bacteroidota bacterium]